MKSSAVLLPFFALILSTYLILLHNPDQAHDNGQSLPSLSNDSQNLTLRCVAGGRVESMLPQSFEVLSREWMEIKYPLATPGKLEVWSDETFGVNVGFELTDIPVTKNGLIESKEAFYQQFDENPMVEVLEAKIVTQEGRDWILLEMISPASDEPIYNLMMLTPIDGKLLVCTFNTAQSMMPEWKDAGKEMMKFLAVVD